MHEMPGDQGVAKCLKLPHRPFALPDANFYSGAIDCPDEDIAFVQDYLTKAPYTEYDRPMQLCDALTLPTGFCLLDKRLVGVAMRHGANSLTADKWGKWSEIRADIEARIANAASTTSCP